jgi:hypothetical protein
MRVMLVLCVASALVLVPVSGATTAKKFPRCAALNKVYPHGVGRPGAKDRTASGDPVTNFRRSRVLYLENRHLDRDKDGVACEKK